MTAGNVGRPEGHAGNERRSSRLALGVILATTVVALAPRSARGSDADAYFDGDRAALEALGRSAAAAVVEHARRRAERSSTRRSTGQVAVAIYQMTLMGLAQIVLAHPQTRAALLPAMRAAADRLVDPATLGYAARRFGRHGVIAMRPGDGHAYLGYINLALGMLRAVDPDTRHAALHDRLTRELATRLDRSPTGLIETYPGETYPPDVAAVAGSIGLHARVTGRSQAGLLARWSARFAASAVHRSGYLVQRVRSGSCQPLDAPRGSGTALTAYFLFFADRALSAHLHRALVERGRRTLLGFGGIREYLPGFKGRGDVNAGPIVLGASVGATGYGLASARLHRDRRLFRELYRSTHLVGAPVDTPRGRTFSRGGVLGNAVLLAVLTARAP